MSGHRTRICTADLWERLRLDLVARGRGVRESGAFLLGTGREITAYRLYDDLAPGCLVSGIIEFPAAGFSRLWDACEELQLQVLADVHTHRFGPQQSLLDRRNPMIATPGHLAIIFPQYALRPVPTHRLGVYEYLGAHAWTTYSGSAAPTIFHLTDIS